MHNDHFGVSNIIKNYNWQHRAWAGSGWLVLARARAGASALRPARTGSGYKKMIHFERCLEALLGAQWPFWGVKIVKI